MVEYLIDLTLNTIPESLLSYNNSVFLISESCIIPESSLQNFTHLDCPESCKPSSNIQVFYIRVLSDFHRGLLISKFLKLFKTLIILTKDAKKFYNIVPNFRVNSYDEFKPENIPNMASQTLNHKTTHISVTRKPYDDEDNQGLEKHSNLKTRTRRDLSHNCRNLSQTTSHNFSIQGKTRKPLESENTEWINEDPLCVDSGLRINRYVFCDSECKFIKIESKSSQNQDILAREQDYLLKISKACKLLSCRKLFEAFQSLSLFLQPKVGIYNDQETADLLTKLFDHNILEFVDGSRKFSLSHLRNYQNDLIKCNFRHFPYLDSNQDLNKIS